VRRNRLWFEEAVPILQQVWETIENERESGYEHRAPKRKTTTSASASTETTDASSTSSLKIVKLNSAIVPNSDNMNSGHDGTTATATATATNMAILMAMNNNMTKKPNRNLKGPSDVLINCFKIDDLEIDETKT
jgi:hypothetical protein